MGVPDVLEKIPLVKPKSISKKNQEIVAAAVLNAALTPIQNAVVWTTDETGQRISYWLRGNASRIEFVAARANLVIPSQEALWSWEETEIPVPLCDCNAWQIQKFEGDCPEAEDPAYRMHVQLVDRISEEEIELYPEPDIHMEEQFELKEYSSEIIPIASVGPYLFARYDEQGQNCSSDRSSQSSSFIVFDLVSRSTVEIINVEEQEKIEESERETAFELIRADRLAAVRNASDLELLAIEPRYNVGLNLIVSYRFGVEAVHDVSDKTWSTTYSGSVLVPAATLPAKLVPFTLPPAVAHAFALGTPTAEYRGWNIVVGSEEQVSKLLTAFAMQ
ncbi:MAG: hypothetical protein GY847_03540 [Proteobacteria bacterium]|nr:hypothetical protein [Pseudomonadota bacterium]